MDSLDVVPAGLLDAARVLRSAASASIFSSSAGADSGVILASVYNEFVRRVVRGGVSEELSNLADVLDAVATTYQLTEGDIARRASGHGD